MHQLIDKKNRIVIYLLLLILLSTISVKNTKNQKNYSAIINDINIVGLSDANNLIILNKLDNFFYQYIFFIRKEEIDKIISQHNIVEEYTIKKIYPSKLYINIKPTKFIARIWGNDQLLVGSNGKLIISKTTDERLPYILGEFSSKEFLGFKKDIVNSRFNFTDFKSITFYPSRRWDILTVNDILIKLPKNDLLKSLNISHKIITNDKYRDSKLIDLRIPNQLIIKND